MLYIINLFDNFHLFIIDIEEPGTGMVLSFHYKVWKIPLEACHGVDRDISPSTEPSSYDDLCIITDGTGVTEHLNLIEVNFMFEIFRPDIPTQGEESGCVSAGDQLSVVIVVAS